MNQQDRYHYLLKAMNIADNLREEAEMLSKFAAINKDAMAKLEQIYQQSIVLKKLSNVITHSYLVHLTDSAEEE